MNSDARALAADFRRGAGVPDDPREPGGNVRPFPDQGQGDDVEPARRTWRRADLTSVLDGTYETPQPTVGCRDDGKGLFYPGRMHVVAAEAESGKTWLALAAVAAELARGNACLYLDFEDDVGGIVGRLLSMGCDPGAIRERFGYIRPEDSVSVVTNRADLIEVLDELEPTLAILDGVTEAMSMHGLDLKDNADVARFGRMLPRWLAEYGPATVLLDHVVKDREQRGRYAIGGVHKLNGLNGAMYLLENSQPFGIGLTGRSRLLIAKDRPGQLRRNGVPGRDGMIWYADMTVESRGEDSAVVSLAMPTEHQDKPFRPTAIMAKISGALIAAPEGLSKNAIETRVGGKRDYVRLAMELLVSEGYVLAEQHGPARIHKLVKPFTDDC